jgi:hypothetical protein
MPGVGIPELAKLVEEDVGSDPTLLIGIYLALIYQQAAKIEAMGISTAAGQVDLRLEVFRSWELVKYLRREFAPGELDTELITRYGAFNHDSITNSDIRGADDSGDPEGEDLSSSGDTAVRYTPRRRRRRITKPRGAKNTGSSGITW